MLYINYKAFLPKEGREKKEKEYKEKFDWEKKKENTSKHLQTWRNMNQKEKDQWIEKDAMVAAHGS